MDKNTFGNSESSVILSEILERYPTYRRKVSSMLVEMSTINKELINSDLSDKLKKSFLVSTLDRFKSKASNLDVKEIETFTKNVVKQYYRIALDKV